MSFSAQTLQSNYSLLSILGVFSGFILIFGSASSHISNDSLVFDLFRGKTAVDESMMTGENLPVPKREGSEVVGGTVNTDHPVIISVSDENVSFFV